MRAILEREIREAARRLKPDQVRAVLDGRLNRVKRWAYSRTNRKLLEMMRQLLSKGRIEM